MMEITVAIIVGGLLKLYRHKIEEQGYLQILLDIEELDGELIEVDGLPL